MPTEFVISTLASFFGLGAVAFAAESAVHMLVPGFTVREVPVNLPNINNLRFAPDGRLTALGYDEAAVAALPGRATFYPPE